MGNCLCLQQEKQEQQAQQEQEQKQSQITSSIVDIYRDATYESTPEFTFDGLQTPVKILRILDGDTVDIALYHEESRRIYRHRVRLYGIDTPEKRPSKSDPYREIEIEASLKSAQALERRVCANEGLLVAKFYKADKYGRLLCTFYDKSGEDINHWMVEHGYAVSYFGKTKKKFQPVLDDSVGESPLDNSQ